MRNTIFISIIITFTLLADVANGCTSESTRLRRTKLDITVIANAIEMFKENTGRYPNSEEGLSILVISETGDTPKINGYDSKGYLKSIPKDTWDREYYYLYPGVKNITSFDLWSYGADGKPGGTQLDVDIGNWPGGFDGIDQYKEGIGLYHFLFSTIFALIFALILLIPIYFIRIVYKLALGKGIKEAFKFYSPGTLIILIGGLGGFGLYIFSPSLLCAIM